jgi:hypothetical protein
MYITNSQYEYGEPLPLCWTALTTILGQKYTTPAIKEATNCMLITMKTNYSKQFRKSRTYTLHPAFLTDDYVSYNIENPLINRNWAKYWRTKQREELTRYKPIHHHLIYYLKQLDFSNLFTLSPEILREVCADDPNKVTYLEKYISAIKDDGVFWEVGTNSERFYSTLTNLKRELKKYIQYNSGKIVCVDIHCSQPLLLSSLLLSYILTTTRNNKKPTIYHYNSSQLLIQQLLKFKKSCENNTFYDDCAKELGLSRQTVKVELLKVFFDKYRHNCKYAKYLQKNFPHIYNYMSSIKQQTSYDYFAGELQRYESKLIIHTICEQIRLFDESIPMWTIHDAIYSTPEHLPIIKSRLLAVYNDLDMFPAIEEE